MLGLLSLPFGIFAPFAIVGGARSWRRIVASDGELRGGASALGGMIAGLIAAATFLAGTIYWVLAS